MKGLEVVGRQSLTLKAKKSMMEVWLEAIIERFVPHYLCNFAPAVTILNAAEEKIDVREVWSC